MHFNFYNVFYSHVGENFVNNIYNKHLSAFCRLFIYYDCHVCIILIAISALSPSPNRPMKKWSLCYLRNLNGFRNVP